MKTCGIIVEYNPLHNGHLHHIAQTRKESRCDCLIAVMSGDFVERGEPAILSKFVRTELALKAGVDIVIELPYLYALGSADLFAFGAVSVLNACGIDELYFGSESDDGEGLRKQAELIGSGVFDTLVKASLAKGESYPKSAFSALSELSGTTEPPKANDILGIQYIANIRKINPNIQYHTVKRLESGYHDDFLPEGAIASATGIRKAVLTDNNIERYVPEYTLDALRHHKPLSWEDFYPELKYQIIANKNQLNDIHDVNEGLGHAIYKAAVKTDHFDKLVDGLVSKRYTRAKIQRALCHILINVTKKEVRMNTISRGPQYLRVLGFNKEKSSCLNRIRNTTSLSVITNMTREFYTLSELDERASLIYGLHSDTLSRKIPVIYEH